MASSQFLMLREALRIGLKLIIAQDLNLIGIPQLVKEIAF